MPERIIFTRRRISRNFFNSPCSSIHSLSQNPSTDFDPTIRARGSIGVGCIDTYGAGLNGSRPLGLRSEVNPQTGFFPFPYTNVATSNVIDQRMQVDEDDLNPALNPGATYWAEGQYVSDNDALAGLAFNNGSYAPISVGAAPNYNLTLGSTVREKFAIQRWPLSVMTVTVLRL